MRRLLHEFEENIRIAFEQIWNHKMRSMLTALGVIIGIVAVTLMGTAIKGIDKGFDDSLDMLGQDIFYVDRFPWRELGDDWFLYRNRPLIQVDYALELNRQIQANPDSLLRVAVPTIGARRGVERGGTNVGGVSINGTTADFDLINTARMLHGRFFTRTEEAGGHNVVVLGYDVADGLFPEGVEFAVDQQVTINRMRFTVIGVLARQGSFLGRQSFDQQAIMPLPTLRKFHSGRWSVSIRVQAMPDADLAAARDELTGMMRGVRRLMPGEDNNFEINQSEALEAELGPIKSGIALAGFFITGLALFVGAIGIMNITFVSVRERTREIGTRRALGARPGPQNWAVRIVTGGQSFFWGR
ncbi:MAG: ABC transporter permease, partial [Opitutales bacterium]|nr:ABC transporter permease [Opitutales bacterium]